MKSVKIEVAIANYDESDIDPDYLDKFIDKIIDLAIDDNVSIAIGVGDVLAVYGIEKELH